MFFQAFSLLFYIFLDFWGKIASLRPSASGLLFSEELLETLRLFNSTIYLELEEMYGTVQKKQSVIKIVLKKPKKVL